MYLEKVKMPKFFPAMAGLFVGFYFSTDVAFSDNVSKIALTSVGAVSSLDAESDPFDPGIGGGFDQKVYFQNHFVPKLADCTTQFESVFID